ncbi:OLC1v1017366C1 [Oldenlandia corymbosa var. corymbosa]|uniref:OLC1v1017366C1 n=1 Tax=Oldenlandia corymbosa var. corymbosa TaxID=529605 RepID=A0AAV1E998_OLDCO|nr:OLC1v1017366C1 [Oldenlandia corymbosa var. corymbosa]
MSSDGLDESGVMVIQREDLVEFTDYLSSENVICKAQFCKLYRGKIPQGWNGLEGGDVTVKAWEKEAAESRSPGFARYYDELVDNFDFEIAFLKSRKATSCSSNLPRLIAYARCDDHEFLGVVYMIFSHGIHCATSGVFAQFFSTGWNGEYADVFAFGVILCELLYKRKVDQTPPPNGDLFLYMEVLKAFPMEKSKVKSLFGKKREFSFVDRSFEKDPYFNALDGPKISKLARLCLDLDLETCPNMQKVVKCLEKLHIGRDNVKMFTAFRY